MQTWWVIILKQDQTHKWTLGIYIYTRINIYILLIYIYIICINIWYAHTQSVYINVYYIHIYIYIYTKSIIYTTIMQYVQKPHCWLWQKGSASAPLASTRGSRGCCALWTNNLGLKKPTCCGQDIMTAYSSLFCIYFFSLIWEILCATCLDFKFPNYQLHCPPHLIVLQCWAPRSVSRDRSAAHLSLETFIITYQWPSLFISDMETKGFYRRIQVALQISEKCQQHIQHWFPHLVKKKCNCEMLVKSSPSLGAFEETVFPRYQRYCINWGGLILLWHLPLPLSAILCLSMPVHLCIDCSSECLGWNRNDSHLPWYLHATTSSVMAGLPLNKLHMIPTHH